MENAYSTNMRLFQTEWPGYSFNQRTEKAFAMFDLENISSVSDIGCLDGKFLMRFPSQVKKFGIDLQRKKNLPSEITF